MFNFLKRKKRYRDYSFNPDEIFLDTLNVSNLNKQQFEGVIEKPISPLGIRIFMSLCALIFLVFSIQLVNLQLIKSSEYKNRSLNNTLRKKPIFAERGLIYDRNNIELAWNISGDTQQKYLDRAYTDLKGFGHVIGYVNYPVKDKNGYYWRDNLEGQDGIEKRFNEKLSGENGNYLTEINAFGEVLSKGGFSEAGDGENIKLSLDARVQDSLYRAVEKQALDGKFVGGAAAIMDVNNGELLAMLSYPEIDVQVFADASDREKINSYINDRRKPFLNRVVGGLYSPGSTVKPFVALAALSENVISKNTIINSTGRIEIQNKYNPEKFSVYKDWRNTGHGPSDVRFAIADSVNTFFYAISGGYENQKGIGILKMKDYLQSFGIGEKTGISFDSERSGVIPDPDWKNENYSDGTWRLGDTYITSIGQFGFQVSPIQMLRSLAAIANNGKLLTPHIISNDLGDFSSTLVDKEISDQDYSLVRAGMRDTVTKGTAQNINVDFVDIASKTGTAQLGVKNEFYHSWSVGFFPYERPKYAYVIVMEKADRGGTGSASRAMRDFIYDVEETYPEFWDSL